MKYAALSVLSVAASATPFVRIGTIDHDAAPVLTASNAKSIPNSYIVKFKSHVKHENTKAHHDWVHSLHVQTENRKLELRKRSKTPFTDVALKGLKHTYNIGSSFLGYSGHFDDSVIDQLRRNPDVSISLYLISSLAQFCHTRHPRPTYSTLHAPRSTDKF
jgi:cerevisin